MRDLINFIEKNKNNSFNWEDWNCCFFVADYLNETKGLDIFSEGRSKFKTKRGAFGTLKRCGFSSLIDLMDKKSIKFGQGVIEPSFARRGDVISVLYNKEFILGLCLGEKVCCLSEDNGYVFFPRNRISYAWRI